MKILIGFLGRSESFRGFNTALIEPFVTAPVGSLSVVYSIPVTKDLFIAFRMFIRG